MDIVKIQTLIAQGRVVELTDIDPTQSFVQIGIYQPDNRKIGSGSNTYPPFVIPLSELASSGAPIGPAGGNLTGSYPNPGVNWAAGSSVYNLLYYPLSTNPAGYLSSINSSNVTTALGYVPEDVANKDIDGTLAANSNTLYSSQRAVKTYVDASVTGVLDDRGNWDASTNLFPTTGGSGPLGTILKGDLWFVSVPGTLGGTPVVVGNNFRALVDNPTLSTDWNILNVGLGYIPENIANKGIPNGYAELDANGKVPASQISYKTIMKHGWSNAPNLGNAAARWYYFGGLTTLALPNALTSNPANTLSGRQSLVPKTGTITSAKFTWYLTSGINPSSLYTVTIRNRTTNTSYVITNSLPLATSQYARVLNIPGLSIPVAENDEVFTVLESPAMLAPTQVQVYMDIDYIIE
jgi:hypothetical protein